MRLIEFLIQEASGDSSRIVSQFRSDFERDNPGETPPTSGQILGGLNRRKYTDDYITNWFMNKGYVRRIGTIVAPTPKGSSFRQMLSREGEPSDISTAQSKGYKAMRRFGLNVMNDIVKDYLDTVDDKTLANISMARELEQEDVAILNGIRDRVEKHRERASFIDAMVERNPDRLGRLVQLGLLNDRNYTFNKGRWDDMVQTINSIDPALIKVLVPKFFQWSTHAKGNEARRVNSIMFDIHPESRNRTPQGTQVWNLLSKLPDDVYAQLKSGRKIKSGSLNDETYKLLSDVMKSFPEADTVDELMANIDAAFKDRVDYKSLSRSNDKVVSRRQGVGNLLRAY